MANPEKKNGGARPGAGRPATGKNPRIHLTVSPEVREAVRLHPDEVLKVLARWARRVMKERQ